MLTLHTIVPLPHLSERARDVTTAPSPLLEIHISNMLFCLAISTQPVTLRQLILSLNTDLQIKYNFLPSQTLRVVSSSLWLAQSRFPHWVSDPQKNKKTNKHLPYYHEGLNDCYLCVMVVKMV